jgi:galactokinase
MNKYITICAPGRAEIGGNHTDHQQGCVLAAAVDLKITCKVKPISAQEIRINSSGYPPDTVKLDDLCPRKEEIGTSAALIRGIAQWFILNGLKIGGIEARTVSQVIGGSGLSSSAAFEVAVGNMLNHLYNDGKVTPVQIAMAGQYAENTHFSKPCGLMDQMACSIGGLVYMDFSKPLFEPVDFDFNSCGYRLCITDTKSSHAGLTGEYAAITAEMGEIARYFGKDYLSQVNECDFYADIAKLRAISDRAVLRAIHFFGENARVKKQVNALTNGDFSAFLKLVNESGDSSFEYLQNIYAKTHEQGLAIAIALSKRILSGNGACRVHGGGFAGTIQAFVPQSLLDDYCNEMDRVFGERSCKVLKICQSGGGKVG